MTIAKAQTAIAALDATAGATNNTGSLGSAITLGNLIVIALCTWDNTPGNVGISDNLGNTYTLASGALYTDPYGVGFLTAPVTHAGSCTVTADKGGSSIIANMAIYELSGWDGTTAADGTPVYASGTGTNAGVAMNSTSVAADFLISAYMGREQSQVTLGTPATGFSADLSGNSPTLFDQFATAIRITTATGAYASGWPSSTNVNTRPFTMGSIAIKGASGGGGGGSSFLINTGRPGGLVSMSGGMRG